MNPLFASQEHIMASPLIAKATPANSRSPKQEKKACQLNSGHTPPTVTAASFSTHRYAYENRTKAIPINSTGMQTFSLPNGRDKASPLVRTHGMCFHLLVVRLSG